LRASKARGKLGLYRANTQKIRKYADTQIRKYDNWGYIGPVIRIESKQSTRNKGNIGQFGVK